MELASCVAFPSQLVCIRNLKWYFLSPSAVESKPDTEVSEEKGSEGDGVRRRKVSLQTPVDHRDDDEEEEGEEEPFRPPQREDDSGFSLNKCIFGAIILLGLGTIFFSGNVCAQHPFTHLL